MTASAFQDKVQELIRTIEDPAELKEKLTELVEIRYPVLVFTEGEEIPLHEFEKRFKRAVCQGNEVRFAQWPVRIVRAADGELLLALGTGADGKIAEDRGSKIEDRKTPSFILHPPSSADGAQR